MITVRKSENKDSSGGAEMAEEYLIKNTTREQREKIVRDSLGKCDVYCDGCASAFGYDLYQDYIDGKKELSEITMEFYSNFVKDEPDPVKGNCGMQ